MIDLLMCRFAESTPPQAPQGQPPEEEFDESSVKDEVNDVVTNIMPWLISLLLHVAVIIVALVVVWGLEVQLSEEKVIVPDIRLGDNPGAPIAVSQQQEQQTSSSRRTNSRTKVQTRSTVTTTEKADMSEIGVAGAVQASANPFGIGPNVGDGFNVGLFGNGGNARSVSFVIDSSGSLLDTMPFVINELKDALGKLHPKQTFTIVFFQDGKVVECNAPRAGLKPATKENISKALEWLDGNAVSPAGRTDPTEAVKRALRYEPEMLILLSDNIVSNRQFGLNPPDLITLFTDPQINKRPTVINTIQFLYPDQAEEYGERPTMEIISDKTGGKYKFVSAKDLGIQ